MRFFTVQHNHQREHATELFHAFIHVNKNTPVIRCVNIASIIRTPLTILKRIRSFIAYLLVQTIRLYCVLNYLLDLGGGSKKTAAVFGSSGVGLHQITCSTANYLLWSQLFVRLFVILELSAQLFVRFLRSSVSRLPFDACMTRLIARVLSHLGDAEAVYFYYDLGRIWAPARTSQSCHVLSGRLDSI